jgi:hypothetical protein
MKISIKIDQIRSIQDLDNYWNNSDYRNLLELFDFPDVQEISDNDLFEMLKMAISDFKPEEAAEKVLTYKLSERLGSGQISQIAHDMRTEPNGRRIPRYFAAR